MGEPLYDPEQWVVHGAGHSISPKMIEGVVDENWVKATKASGLLYHKELLHGTCRIDGREFPRRKGGESERKRFLERLTNAGVEWHIVEFDVHVPPYRPYTSTVLVIGPWPLP